MHVLCKHQRARTREFLHSDIIWRFYLFLIPFTESLSGYSDQELKCELCPQKDGALKRTDTGVAWCHVVCALFIPEAWFANVQTMEPIVLKNVPPERFNKVCYICEENGRQEKSNSGACMQCNRNGCKMNFHVTCAQAQGLLCEEAGNYGDNVKYCGYCVHHYKKLKRDANIKQIPAFKPIPADNASPEKTDKLGPISTDTRIKVSSTSTETRVVKRGNKAETKEVFNNLGYHLPSTEKEKQPATPPLSNASSGIGTSTMSETSTISPTESPNQEEDTENGTFPTCPASIKDRHVLHRSVSSGSLSSVQSADLRLTSEAGPMFLPSGSLGGEAFSGSFTGSLDSFITSAANKLATTAKTASQSDNEIDQAANRSRSQEKFEKKLKRTKQLNPTGNKKMNRNPSTDSKDSSPPLSRKVRRKPEITTPSLGANSGLSLNNFSVFGGSPHFQSLTAPGPLTFSFTQNASASALGSCNDPADGACGPPKLFPSLQSPEKEPPNGDFPTSLEQLLERQWEQGSQFLMKQGEHFDIASLLHCLHQLKSENQRLEGHIQSLSTRREHLLAVNARLAIPFTSPLHADSFLSSEKNADSKNMEPSLVQDVTCLTADNPLLAGATTTVAMTMPVSSLSTVTSSSSGSHSVQTSSISNTPLTTGSIPVSMETGSVSSSPPDKSKLDVT
ncbi:protein AF-17-like isoform X3 [Ostrea edulis]|uniref:protein AF-17-like isoform X3 n=1 Tax=Ostrea edulis TaxID=37623 RepID=UPI0024AF98AA|nr:protein AF-17-like isoform X3 [Ostrea edulis]